MRGGSKGKEVKTWNEVSSRGSDSTDRLMHKRGIHRKRFQGWKRRRSWSVTGNTNEHIGQDEG